MSRRAMPVAGLRRWLSCRFGAGTPAGRALASLHTTELLAAAMLFAAGTLSILLTRAPGGISLFWPGSVIAACLLIRAQRVRWVSAAPSRRV